MVTICLVLSKKKKDEIVNERRQTHDRRRTMHDDRQTNSKGHLNESCDVVKSYFNYI